MDPATIIAIVKLAEELSELYQDHINMIPDELDEIELVDMMVEKRKLQLLEDSIKGSKVEKKVEEIKSLLDKETK